MIDDDLPSIENEVKNVDGLRNSIDHCRNKFVQFSVKFSTCDGRGDTTDDDECVETRDVEDEHGLESMNRNENVEDEKNRSLTKFCSNGMHQHGNEFHYDQREWNCDLHRDRSKTIDRSVDRRRRRKEYLFITGQIEGKGMSNAIGINPIGKGRLIEVNFFGMLSNLRPIGSNDEPEETLERRTERVQLQNDE